MPSPGAHGGVTTDLPVRGTTSQTSDVIGPYEHNCARHCQQHLLLGVLFSGTPLLAQIGSAGSHEGAMKVRLEPSPLSCLVRRIKRVGVARAHNLLNWWPKATCSADRHIFYLLQGYSKSYLRGGLKLLRRWESEREKRWIDLSTHEGYIYV